LVLVTTGIRDSDRKFQISNNCAFKNILALNFKILYKAEIYNDVNQFHEILSVIVTEQKLIYSINNIQKISSVTYYVCLLTI
jgi:hypothetical protein